MQNRYSNRPVVQGVPMMVYVEGYGPMPLASPPQSFQQPQGKQSVPGRKLVTCMDCKKQNKIFICYHGSPKHCGLYEGHEHTHISCDCGKQAFKGAVRFITFFNEPPYETQIEEPSKTEQTEKKEEETEKE